MKKKIVCILLLLALMLPLIAIADPILYQNNKWYITSMGIEDRDIKTDIASSISFKYIDQETGYMKTIALKLEGGGLFGPSSPVIYRANRLPDKIAGLQPGYICYHYLVPEYTDYATIELQQLYMVQYCFMNDTFKNEEMFSELSRKLTSLYGEPEILSDTHHIWRDSDGHIGIVLDDSIDGSVVYDNFVDAIYEPDEKYMNTLTLTYTAPDAYEIFEKALETYGITTLEEWNSHADEREEQRQQDTTGL